MELSIGFVIGFGLGLAICLLREHRLKKMLEFERDSVMHYRELCHKYYSYIPLRDPKTGRFLKKGIQRDE